MKNTLYIILVLALICLEVCFITDCDILENSVTLFSILGSSFKVNFTVFRFLPLIIVGILLFIENYPLSRQEKNEISFVKLPVYAVAFVTMLLICFKSLKLHSLGAYFPPLASIGAFTAMFFTQRKYLIALSFIALPVVFHLFIGGWVENGKIDSLNLKISNKSDISLVNIPSNLIGSTIENCTFKKTLKVKGVDASHSTFLSCNFSAIKNIEQCTFEDAKIGGCNFKQTEIYNCNFDHVKTTIERISKSDTVRMDSCLIANSSFKGANLNNVNFSNSSFQNSYFDNQTESTLTLFLNAKMTQLHGLTRKHIQYCNKIKGADLPPQLRAGCE